MLNIVGSFLLSVLGICTWYIRAYIRLF